MNPEYRKRLGSEHKIGPMSWGHKLGDIVKRDTITLEESPERGLELLGRRT